MERQPDTEHAPYADCASPVWSEVSEKTHTVWCQAWWQGKRIAELEAEKRALSMQLLADQTQFLESTQKLYEECEKLKRENLLLQLKVERWQMEVEMHRAEMKSDDEVIEELTAENKRLREALAQIAKDPCPHQCNGRATRTAEDALEGF